MNHRGTEDTEFQPRIEHGGNTDEGRFNPCSVRVSSVAKMLSLCSLCLCGDYSVFRLAALDFDFVAVREELRTEAEGFALQAEVDDLHGLPGLLLGRAVRDLAGVELEVEPADGDDFHEGRADWQG